MIIDRLRWKWWTVSEWNRLEMNTKQTVQRYNRVKYFHSRYYQSLMLCSFVDFCRSSRSSWPPCADDNAAEAPSFDRASLPWNFGFSPSQPTAAFLSHRKYLSSAFPGFASSRPALRRKMINEIYCVIAERQIILLGISGNGLVDRFKLSSFSLSVALNTVAFCCSCCFAANAFESVYSDIYLEGRDFIFRLKYKLPKLRPDGRLLNTRVNLPKCNLNVFTPNGF